MSASTSQSSSLKQYCRVEYERLQGTSTNSPGNGFSFLSSCPPLEQPRMEPGPVASPRRKAGVEEPTLKLTNWRRLRPARDTTL